MISPGQRERRRRFYRAVSVEPDETGFAVALDGRRVRSPAGAPLIAPTERLAALFAEEWDRQGDEIDPGAMPATRLGFTVLDRTGEARADLAEEVARYAGSDLLCYRAEAPRALVQREAAGWDPWLEWAAERLGVRLAIARGVAPAAQPPEALERVRRLALDMEPFRLTGTVFATALFGSAVLGFALAEGAIEAEAAYDLSRLEEAFQEESWGIDAEAEARVRRLRGEAVMIGRWFAAL